MKISTNKKLFRRKDFVKTSTIPDERAERTYGQRTRLNVKPSIAVKRRLRHGNERFVRSLGAKAAAIQSNVISSKQNQSVRRARPCNHKRYFAFYSESDATISIRFLSSSEWSDSSNFRQEAGLLWQFVRSLGSAWSLESTSPIFMKFGTDVSSVFKVSISCLLFLLVSLVCLVVPLTMPNLCLFVPGSTNKLIDWLIDWCPAASVPCVTIKAKGKVQGHLFCARSIQHCDDKK